MEINVIGRSGYEKIYWGERYLSGITDETAAHGDKLTMLSADDDPDILSGKHAIVLSSSKRWLTALIGRADFKPILLTPMQGGGISYVTFNYAGGVKSLLARLREEGFSKTALVSCNGDSFNDLAKKRTFVEVTDAEDQVYYHRNSIGFGIFDEFLRDVSRYDSVICTNDIVYLMLKKRLTTAGIDCSGIGFATFSDRRFDIGDSVISAVTDYYRLGRAAVGCYRMLGLSEQDALIEMKIECGFAGKGKGGSIRETEPDKAAYLDDSALYAQQIKYLLGGADRTDIEILRRSLDGESYEDISEGMYMSLNTLKRRMKAMIELSGCSGKNELIALLKQYL